MATKQKQEIAAPAIPIQPETGTQPILKIIINRRQFDLPDSANSGEKLKNIKLK